jgi:ribosomal protein S20
MVIPDILIPQLADELRRLQKEALAAVQVNDKATCERALNEQIKVIDSLLELGKSGSEK